jgi:hypothetical protein
MTPTSFHRTSDLPQRPRMTSPPRVRIEGVRGSNPLSSIEFLKVRWPVRFSGSRLGSHCGSQDVDFGYSWGFAPWLRRRRHLLRPPGRLPGQRPPQDLRRVLARRGLARLRHRREAAPQEGQRQDQGRGQGQAQDAALGAGRWPADSSGVHGREGRGGLLWRRPAGTNRQDGRGEPGLAAAAAVGHREDSASDHEENRHPTL